MSNSHHGQNNPALFFEHCVMHFRLPVNFAIAYDLFSATPFPPITLQTSQYVLPTILGILSHNCIFRYGEWHISAPFVLKCHIGAFILGIMVDFVYGSGNISESLRTSALAISVYASALLASMGIYRKFLHRLRDFPGPWIAGITKLWHVYHCANSQNHLLLDRMHQKYGQFVRTGPEEITIFHPEVLRAVDGPGNRCTKAVWYDLLLPELAVNTTRSKPEHDRRRRIWDHGFTAKALMNYEEQMMKHGDVLERGISDLVQKGQPVNVSAWFYWFTFDVMGEFAFAKSFGMLESERWHIAVVMLRKAMRLLGPFSPVPWLAQIAFSMIPWFWVIRDWFAMLAWCRDRMKERIQVSFRLQIVIAVCRMNDKLGTLDDSRQARRFTMVDRRV